MTVASVCVTHNRLAALQKCIAAIRSQTLAVDEIIIVNNGSTDRTCEWVKTQEDLNVVSQQNSGSGGGQHSGIKLALGNGHSWIWCMDDDGIPANDALSKLLQASAKFSSDRVFNSLVIDSDDHSRIAFGYHLAHNVLDKQRGFRYDKVDDLNRVTDNFVCDGLAQFFNSTLLGREVVEKVGLPLPELFIRGDELEYVYRIQRKGFRTYTVTNSYVFHRNPLIEYWSFFGKRIGYERMSDWKRYYALRNANWIDETYWGIRMGILDRAKAVLVAMFGSFVGTGSVSSSLRTGNVALRALRDANGLTTVLHAAQGEPVQVI